MRRVRQLFEKLSERGHGVPIRRATSAVESIYRNASMSQYPESRRADFGRSAPFGSVAGGDSSGLIAAGSYGLTRPLKQVSFEDDAPFGTTLREAPSSTQSHSEGGDYVDDAAFLQPPPPPPAIRVPRGGDLTVPASPPRRALKQPHV